MNNKEALEIMCERCINHEVCCGTGCEPKRIIKEALIKTERETYDELYGIYPNFDTVEQWKEYFLKEVIKMKNSFETLTRLKRNEFDLKELIGKATARKVIRITMIEKDFSYDVCKCPNCKTSLISAKKPNYCDECGQKLNWNKEKGK